MPNEQKRSIKFVFFGSPETADFILRPLREKGLEPVRIISSSRDELPTEELRALDADVFVVASFGKILPKEIIEMPKHGTLNIHPSLLPKLRGPSPIRSAILREDKTGVSIIAMDEKMDHGPILAMEEVPFAIWPESHSVVEKRLWQKGTEMLAEILPKWIRGEIEAVPQDDTQATFCKLIKKEDSDISNDAPELAYRKVLAYEGWPRARRGDLIITDAHLENGELKIDRVIPPGKKEMDYQDYLRGRK